jgi:acyl dehydratase
MALNYDMLMSLPPLKARQAYTARDTMLYALGLGIGIRAVADPACLRFVFEEDLVALPTMAVVLAHPGFWMAEPRYGLDWKKLLHGDQSLEMHRPLPVEGSVHSETIIEQIFDKGAEKGALMYVKRRLYDEATGHQLATIGQGLFLRGDGGFGGISDGAPTPHMLPSRPADAVEDVLTRPEQAFIYRLSGDYNPLHVSPKIAAEAGFPRPVLQGLATYGIAGHVALMLLCSGDTTRFLNFNARFSSPVYPGETLRVELWREGSGAAALRVRALDRDVIVLQNGSIKYKG